MCCHRIRYQKVVKVYDDLLKEDILLKSKKPNIIEDAIGTPSEELQVKTSNEDEPSFYICLYCEKKLKQGHVPPVSHKNKLELFNIKQYECLNLSEAETALISTTILYQMFYRLPKSLWAGVKNRIVSVPILETDIKETIKCLPRTPSQAGLVKVKLKRKKSMKNTHLEQYINVEKTIEALNLLINLDNPFYRNMSIIENYEDFLLDNDLEGYFMVNPEDEILNKDEVSLKADDENENGENENTIEDEIFDDLDDDESVDPMKKWKFDFSDKITFVNDYPEIDVVEDVAPKGADEDVEPNSIDEDTEPDEMDEPVIVAPGEGKKPVNILRTKDWDLRSFPQLNPDARNGLHEERPVKLTDIEFFQQRLLNVDRRYANNSEYLFAAHAYLEMKRMESNINISYMRGKKNAKGEYTLEDAYSVMENMPGTPRYWAKKKMEIIGKLYNLGPFPLFYTLSCAEARWNENFTTFLQEHTIEYEYE